MEFESFRGRVTLFGRPMIAAFTDGVLTLHATVRDEVGDPLTAREAQSLIADAVARAAGVDNPKAAESSAASSNEVTPPTSEEKPAPAAPAAAAPSEREKPAAKSAKAKPAASRAEATGAAIKADIENREAAKGAVAEPATAPPLEQAPGGWNLSGKGSEKDDAGAEDDPRLVDLTTTIPEKIKSARRLLDVVLYLFDHGYQTQELMLTACRKLSEHVGVISGIPAADLQERVYTVFRIATQGRG